MIRSVTPETVMKYFLRASYRTARTQKICPARLFELLLEVVHGGDTIWRADDQTEAVQRNGLI